MMHELDTTNYAGDHGKVPGVARTPTSPLPREGSRTRQVYDMIAEFPGVKVTAAEIAVECGMTSRFAGSYGKQLARRGLIKSEANGHGSRALYWVEL